MHFDVIPAWRHTPGELSDFFLCYSPLVRFWYIHTAITTDTRIGSPEQLCRWKGLNILPNTIETYWGVKVKVYTTFKLPSKALHKLMTSFNFRTVTPSLPWCHLKTTNSVTFETIRPFRLLLRTGMWKDFHQNISLKVDCYRTGKYNCLRRVLPSFSPESLQAGQWRVKLPKKSLTNWFRNYVRDLKCLKLDKLMAKMLAA